MPQLWAHLVKCLVDHCFNIGACNYWPVLFSDDTGITSGITSRILFTRFIASECICGDLLIIDTISQFQKKQVAAAYVGCFHCCNTCYPFMYYFFLWGKVFWMFELEWELWSKSVSGNRGERYQFTWYDFTSWFLFHNYSVCNHLLFYLSLPSLLPQTLQIQLLTYDWY